MWPQLCQSLGAARAVLHLLLSLTTAGMGLFAAEHGEPKGQGGDKASALCAPTPPLSCSYNATTPALPKPQPCPQVPACVRVRITAQEAASAPAFWRAAPCTHCRRTCRRGLRGKHTNTNTLGGQGAQAGAICTQQRMHLLCEGHCAAVQTRYVYMPAAS